MTVLGRNRTAGFVANRGLFVRDGPSIFAETVTFCSIPFPAHGVWGLSLGVCLMASLHIIRTSVLSVKP